MSKPKCPRRKIEGALYWYQGTLSVDKMEPVAKKAYSVYRHKKERCLRPSHAAYKYYGARGVRVLYTPREFIGWWIDQQERLKLKNPSVSRIDHSGNYEFGNIKLEEMRDNILDMNVRLNGHRPTRAVICIDNSSDEPLMRFDSIKDAALVTGVERSTVSHLCARRINQSDGFTFRYAEANGQSR